MNQSYRKFMITALLLTGWYLMLPPAAQRNGVPWPDSTAPVSRWTIAKSFDTAKACEADLAKHRKQFRTYQKASRSDPAAAFWSSFYVTASGSATCIASDDARLRDSAEEPTPDLKQSTAVQPPGE